jgi:hypothetical protein
MKIGTPAVTAEEAKVDARVRGVVPTSSSHPSDAPVAVQAPWANTTVSKFIPVPALSVEMVRRVLARGV